MKLPLLLFVAGCLPLAAQTQPDSSGPGSGVGHLPANLPPSSGNAITDQELLALRARANVGELQKKGEEHKSYELAETSTFIQIGDKFTLVPKDAVLDVPKKLASLIVTAPKGTFVVWSEMQAANRNKLARFEVTLDQASGKTPIDPAKLEAARRGGCVLVAVMQNGAISVAGVAAPAKP